MTAATVHSPGDRVRLIGRLGTMKDLGQYKFEEYHTQDGELGTYHGPHPSLDGWHVVTIEHDGETLYVPVGADHFEAVA